MTISSWLHLQQQPAAQAAPVDSAMRPLPGGGASLPDADRQTLFRQALAAAVQQAAVGLDRHGRPLSADGAAAPDPRLAGASDAWPMPGAAGGADASRAVAGAMGTTGTAGKSGGGLANVFMRMLIEQIRNQDPLEPMKPEQMVTQLTQMNEVESMAGISKLMHGNASMLESMLVLSMGSAVGTRVAVRTGQLRIDDAHTVIHASFTQPSGSSDTTVTLVGADGTRHAIDLGPHAAGEVAFDVDPHRLALPRGCYRIEVDAGDGAARSAGIPVEVTGVLRRVRMTPDGTVALGVAGVGEVGMSDLTNFLGRRAAAASVAARGQPI